MNLQNQKLWCFIELIELQPAIFTHTKFQKLMLIKSGFLLTT